MPISARTKKQYVVVRKRNRILQIRVVKKKSGVAFAIYVEFAGKNIPKITNFYLQMMFSYARLIDITAVI